MNEYELSYVGDYAAFIASGAPSAPEALEAKIEGTFQSFVFGLIPTCEKSIRERHGDNYGKTKI